MNSLILAALLLGQQDYMNSRRFTGTINKVEFLPFATITFAVPGRKHALVLTAKGVALFKDENLKKTVLGRIKKEFIGKSFVIIVGAESSTVLQDVILVEKDLRFPSSLVLDGLLYANENSPINGDQRKIAKRSRRGFYGLPATQQASILAKTEKSLREWKPIGHPQTQ